MPATLTDDQVAKLRLILRERRTACLKDIRHALKESDNERYVDLVGSVHDVADESVADLLSDLGILEIDRSVLEVNDIEAALLRIAHMNYGVCIDCSDNIGYERLTAYPVAKRCWVCQQRHESSHAGVGHASM